MIQGGFQDLLDEFLLEARERADEVEALLLQLEAGDPATREEALAKTRRELHTLKGNSGMMGFSDLQQLTHHMEDQVEELDLDEPRIDPLLGELDNLRRGLDEIGSQKREIESVTLAADDEALPVTPAGPAAESPAPVHEALISSVRVPFSKIDQLVEMQAESLIYRNRLADAIQRGKALAERGGDQGGTQRGDQGGDSEDRGERVAAWEEVEGAGQSLEKILKLLQEQVTELSMVPLQGLLRSLRRVVHDESSREGKKVELEILGGETPIDKTLLEAAGDALGHLVRNAVIHGIEPPAARRRAGKPETGRVRITATLDANEVRIEIADDGAGIDLTALRKRAAKTRGQTAAEIGSDFTLLFEEGLSTREATDLGAGRGVGLTVVKTSVESHGGRIAVASRRGTGTRFTLRLPVTASILRSLTLRADGEEYALPLTAVAETLRPRPEDRHEIHHAGVVRWRGIVVPVLDLGYVFGTAARPRDDGFVVVMDLNGRYRALAADEIVGIRDIVVKGLDPIVGEPRGISGSTILGDGRVIMILNPAALAAIPPFTPAKDEQKDARQ